MSVPEAIIRNAEMAIPAVTIVWVCVHVRMAVACACGFVSALSDLKVKATNVAVEQKPKMPVIPKTDARCTSNSVDFAVMR